MNRFGIVMYVVPCSKCRLAGVWFCPGVNRGFGITTHSLISLRPFCWVICADLYHFRLLYDMAVFVFAWKYVSQRRVFGSINHLPIGLSSWCLFLVHNFFSSVFHGRWVVGLGCCGHSERDPQHVDLQCIADFVKVVPVASVMSAIVSALRCIRHMLMIVMSWEVNVGSDVTKSIIAELL